MATKQEIHSFFDGVYTKSNRIIEIVLIGYFVFGILLSFFYDTYFVGIGVGALNMILYFGSKALFGKTRYIQYVASLVFGIFMAQFIYQMHGLFEMHFTAFIAIIAMITYQNKYAFLPQALFVVIHHSSFAYIQYLGVINEVDAYKNIYFTQLEFMDFQTFLFHAGLYALGVVLAAIYAHNLEGHTTENAINIIAMKENEMVMQKNISLANEIAGGNLENSIIVSEGDKMGEALQEMRESLKQSADREKEEKFINVGIAEIGEIIRANENDIDELSFRVISYLVKYLNANQGAIFVRIDQDEEVFLELKGCYAYERKKYLDKKVSPGDGILGQCYLEEQPIILKEIPENYINITSGLGNATPDFLILIPVKTDHAVEGVIEIASFREFEQFKVDFLKKVCENIASVIASSKINAQTRELFRKSQEQTEMLRSQEEEMRQNMEELSATQEEMQRKTREFESRFSALNESGLAFSEFHPDGSVISGNPAFSAITGVSPEQLISMKYDELTGRNNTNSFGEILTRLHTDRKHSGIFQFNETNGQSTELFGTFVLITDDSDEPKSIVFYGMKTGGRTKPAVRKEQPVT